MTREDYRGKFNITDARPKGILKNNYPLKYDPSKPRVLEGANCPESIQNCEFCDVNLKCLRCKNGYRPNANYTFCEKRNQCKDRINCNLCPEDPSKCTLCRDGYVSTKNKFCVSTSSCIINDCFKCESLKPEVCIKCKEKYRLVDSLCTLDIPEDGGWGIILFLIPLIIGFVFLILLIIVFCKRCVRRSQYKRVNNNIPTLE